MSLAPISRYLPEVPPDQGKQQRWITFLQNHKDAITATDFFVVPTIGFRLLYVDVVDQSVVAPGYYVVKRFVIVPDISVMRPSGFGI